MNCNLKWAVLNRFSFCFVQLATWFFTTFTASDIKFKVHSLNGVQYLYTKINPDQLDVPQFIHEYDIMVSLRFHIQQISQISPVNLFCRSPGVCIW